MLIINFISFILNFHTTTLILTTIIVYKSANPKDWHEMFLFSTKSFIFLIIVSGLNDLSVQCLFVLRLIWFLMKKCSERRRHCALAVVRRSQKFSPRHRPLPGVQEGQSLISWRWSQPSLTDPVWWRSMHAVSSYHGNRCTNAQTGSITIHCTAKLSMQCNKSTQQKDNNYNEILLIYAL